MGLKSTDVTSKLEICGDVADEDREVLRLWLEGNHGML